jgi:sec-independent protein translocase protein TatA
MQTEGKPDTPSIATPAAAAQPVQSQRVDPPAATEHDQTEARPA